MSVWRRVVQSPKRAKAYEGKQVKREGEEGRGGEGRGGEGRGGEKRREERRGEERCIEVGVLIIG